MAVLPCETTTSAAFADLVRPVFDRDVVVRNVDDARRLAAYLLAGPRRGASFQTLTLGDVDAPADAHAWLWSTDPVPLTDATGQPIPGAVEVNDDGRIQREPVHTVVASMCVLS